MPLLVNHDVRRSEVAAATSRLIATTGLESVTVRDVARATGFSTAVVSHYFTDKRDLLLFTYRSTAWRSDERLDRAEQGGDLTAFIEAFLPLDEERLREWTVWIAFWGKATCDAEFAAEQRRWMAHARARIERRLRALQAGDFIRSDLDTADAAWRLVTLVFGIGTQAMFEPADWPPRRQRAALSSEISRHTGG